MKNTYRILYISNMNRLILVGNGFDLAHGLKTSYKDFIHFYIHKVFDAAHNNNSYEDHLIKISRTSYFLKEAEARFKWVEDYLTNFNKNKRSITYSWSDQRSSGIQYYTIDYKSEFLKSLLANASVSKWVDIEGVFYEELISILDKEDKKITKEPALQKLNESMRYIIHELQLYLSGLLVPDKILQYDNIIYSRIEEKDVQSKPIKIQTQYNRPFQTSMPKETIILNFNYTDTVSHYMTKSSYKSPRSIFIHGKLNDLNNPIIFGFGDEVDRRYEDLENSPAHGWFEYIKSFWYLKNNNYRDLTSFIDSDEYQVLVLGHSCGLSDRTMLQMILQHDNCRSIKLYYYGDKDLNNHRQTLHEVARHFKDKGLMRRRIVSEENSQRMPQHND